MRFDAGVGDFTLGVREESVQLLRGMGTICLQVGLDVKALPAKEAGRFLALQADLYGIHGSYQRTLVGRVTEMLPFTPETGIERPVLKFLITASQLHAINEARDGDLRMELEVTGTLPQAVGYPGSTTEVLHFSVAKSRWIDQINALGPSVAFEMQVPFPLEDDPRAEAAQHLRSAQRRLLHHAVIEQVIADSKAAALAHLPSAHFNANAAWLTLWAMAYNLLRAAGAVASAFHAKATTATIRAHLASSRWPNAARTRSSTRRSAPAACRRWSCHGNWPAG
jgi:hypothetical protein